MVSAAEMSLCKLELCRSGLVIRVLPRERKLRNSPVEEMVV